MFEPNFTKVVSSVRKNIGITQSVIELKLPTNENDINKIYSVGAKSTLTSFEPVGRELTFFGVVDFQAVYEKDGVLSLDYCAEFKDKFVAEEDIDGEVIVSSNVVDVNSSIVAGGIRVVAVVEVVVDVIESKDINVLSVVDCEGVHLSTEEITYSTYLGRAYEKFDVSEEIRIDQATNILMVTPSVCLTRVDPRENYIVVSGKINLDICYQEGVEFKDISTMNKELDFVWEVAFSGVEEDSIVQSLVGVVTNEIKITTTIEDGSAIMGVYIPVVYSGYVYKETKMQVIDDLYVEKNYLSVTCENFYSICSNNTITFKDNIGGTASVLDTSPFIDEVLGVCANNLILAGCKVVDEVLSVEGVANTTVIYYTKETNEITSVLVEMPFVVEQKVEGKDANIVSICLTNLSAKSKRGKEIEVSAEINIYADLYDAQKECVISNVVIGEEKPIEDCALSIYIAKPNQTIWDIAKETSTSQELILDQNPNIVLPIKAGDKLVIYKPAVVEF